MLSQFTMPNGGGNFWWLDACVVVLPRSRVCVAFQDCLLPLGCMRLSHLWIAAASRLHLAVQVLRPTPPRLRSLQALSQRTRCQRDR